MKFLPTTLEPIDVLTNKQLIPRVIYQTWKSNEMPEYLYRCAYSWISKNSDYHYEFYDDSRVEKFFYEFDCSDFSFTKDELLKAYNSYAHPVGIADMWRYLIIYANGGVYMDIDTTCTLPLKDYVDSEVSYVTGIDLDRGVHQWGIIMSPKHPFIKETIENAIRCTLQRKRIPGTEHIAENNLELYTGPWVMNYSIKKLLSIKPERHFAPGKFTFKLYNKPYTIKILPKGHMNGYVSFNYDKYREILKTNNIQYWQEATLWK
jgi:mannosyltransferase OCH1-like enzyme